MKTIFFHIPKTNGRNFYFNTTRHIELEILKKGEQYKDLLQTVGHRSLRVLDNEEVFGYLFLRDPIKRTVSHWLHIYHDRPSDTLVKYLTDNPNDPLVNYQTKYLSYSNADFVSLCEGELGQFDANIELAKERINKLAYIFTMENQDKDFEDKFRNILYDRFCLKPTFDIKTNYPVSINYNTKKVYDKLTTSELSELEDLFSLDRELYNNTKYNKI